MAKLYFYYSAMNAGKTTNLLQSNYNYQERGMGTILFTPKIDNRVREGVIASRIGLQADAYAFTAESDLYEYAKQAVVKSKHKIACVLVDEAHFMNKNHVIQLTDIVDKLNLPVLAYGLRSDYTGEVFEGSKYLFAYADELSEIKTVCHCGKKATMNLRFDETGQAVKQGAQVVIGGNDQYISTCRKHFKEPVLRNSVPSLVNPEAVALL
jgi:thymidine kinase